MARAIELPDSGVCGMGLDPAYRDRDSLAALLASLDGRRGRITARIADDAARYLPVARAWNRTRVYFVIASQATFDAVTMATGVPGESAPVVLVNLTDVLSYGVTTEERVEALEHVLAHELFHAGMRQVESALPGWEAFRGVPASDFEFIAKVMLDEGVAHYIDWRNRPGSDSLFTWKPSSRETRAFAQLGIACRRLGRRDESRADRREVLQLAANGPLWSKYGAISGMFAAYRIEMARGLEGLRRVAAEGPAEFLRTYREVGRQNPHLAAPPRELIP